MNQVGSVASQSEFSTFTKENIFGEHFTREYSLELIRRDQETGRIFDELPHWAQEDILSFMQGEKGLPVTYDSFFKKITDPFAHPERLESLISSIIGHDVHIKTILNPEGVRLAESGSFVIMDVVVEGEDGSVIDVEIQKMGYAFPGERSSCYISDMIMRQYNRIKSEQGKKFTYRNMKPVYLIVFMEKSSEAFRMVAPQFIHKQVHAYSSNVQVTDLNNIIYISLDTFRENIQNITNKLEAWLTFLSATSYEAILKLVEAYPEFLEYYHEINLFRHKPKELIGMFSEALAILDRNTEIYMFEEMQKQVEELKMIKTEYEKDIKEKIDVIAAKETEIAEKETEIAEKETEIAEKETEIAEKETEIAAKETEIAAKDTQIETQKEELEMQKNTIAALTEEIEKLKMSLNI